MIVPKGGIIINLGWLDVDVCIITSKIKMNELLKINKAHEENIKFFRNEWEKGKGSVLEIDLGPKRYFFMLLKDKGSLVHECVHLTESICDYLGIKFLSKSNYELRAFMISHVYGLISKRLRLIK